MKFVEFLNWIVENVENEEVKAVATARLEREAKEAKTRAAYAEKQKAKKAEAKTEIREKVLAVLTAEPQTATEIVEAVGVEGLTRQAIPPLLKPLVEEGKVVKEQFTVAGAKGKVVGYKLA